MTHLQPSIDTLSGIVIPTSDKVREISLLSRNLLKDGFTSTELLQQVAGTSVACHAMVPLGLLWLRPISVHFAQNFKRGRDNLEKKVSLQVPEVQEALRFWADPGEVRRGAPPPPPPGFVAPNQTLMTDSSELGWGAVLVPLQCSGLWTREESFLHIYLLSLAVFRVLQPFELFLQGGVILLQTANTTVMAYANTTVMAYANRMGVTRSSSLDSLPHQITL